MPRFKLLIEDAGTRYSGWQSQKHARIVQGELDRAIRTASGRAPIRPFLEAVYYRSDAGSHPADDRVE